LCLRGIAPWDSLLGVALPLAMGLTALGALGLGLIRLVLMAQVVACSDGMTDPELQALTEDLAKRLGLARPPVLLCIYHRPLALASDCTKGCMQTMSEPWVGQFSAAQSLVGAGETIKCRIERLLTAPEPPHNTHRSHAVIIRISVSALVMLLLPGVANVTL